MTVQEMDYKATQSFIEEDPQVCVTDSFGESCIGSYSQETGTSWFVALLIDNYDTVYYTVYYGTEQEMQEIWDKHILDQEAAEASEEYDELASINSVDENDGLPEDREDAEIMGIVNLMECNGDDYDYAYISGDEYY